MGMLTWAVCESAQNTKRVSHYRTVRWFNHEFRQNWRHEWKPVTFSIGRKTDRSSNYWHFELSVNQIKECSQEG